MGTEVRAANEAVALVLEQPEPGGPRELAGTLRFVDGSAARSAKVGLSLFGQETRGSPMEVGRIDATTEVGAGVTIARADEPSPFSIGVPPVASSFVGGFFAIGVGVVVMPDVGPPLRVLVEVPPAEGARLVLRRLPKEAPLATPARFLVGLLIVIVSAALVIPAGHSALALVPLLGVIGGAVLAISGRTGIVGWLRVGNGLVKLEAGDGPQGRELVVTVRAPRAVGGRVRLAAVEYEVERSQPYVHGEITSTEAALARAEGRVLAARVPLPAATAAPPSLALRAPRKLIAIRWLAKLELEAASGARARLEVPVHVGIEPADPDRPDTAR